MKKLYFNVIRNKMMGKWVTRFKVNKKTDDRVH